MGEDLLIGRVLGGSYRLIRKIGQGGMGAVYLAEHARLHKKVAIKTLHRETTADEEAYRRFQREAQIASELGHPHIVQVLDFDHTEDGLPFMVMEYLEGEDLGALLNREGRLSLDQTVSIIRDVGCALQAVHDKGVVHRDLKPKNIFLCRFGHRSDFPKVLDFGVSKICEASTLETRSQSYLGTPFYMAPEQAEGRSSDADARTDVFALGTILYRAFTGLDAFVGDSLPAVLYRIVHIHPAPVHEASPGMPPAVSDVVRQAMAKNPQDRFQSVADLVNALEVAARLEPAHAGRTLVEGLSTSPATVPSIDDRQSPMGQLSTMSAASGEQFAATHQPPPRSEAEAGAARGFATGSGALRWLWIGLPVALAVAASIVLGVVSRQGSGDRTRPSGRRTVAAVASSPDPTPDHRFESAIDAVRPSVLQCYNTVAMHKPNLEGKLVVEIKINALSQIEQVKVAEEGLGDPSVAACVITQLRGIEVPAGMSRRRIVVPFRFSPTRTLAILPFENMTNDAALDWLRGGISETLSTKLGQIPWVVLVDRLKLQAELAKQSSGPITAPSLEQVSRAAKAAGARFAIMGAFQKAGQQVRFTARLLMTDDGEIRATADATGKIAAIFSIQDELARKLADAMNIPADPNLEKAISLRTAHSVAILELLGKASNALSAVNKPSEVKKAQALFREVIALDPSIPEAHMGLARALWALRHTSDHVKNSKAIRAELEKAIELRPDYHEAITLLGFMHWTDGKYDEAFQMQRRAIQLKPRYALGYYGLALGFASKGKAEDALAMIRRAADLDPNDPEFTTQYGAWTGIFKRDFKEAVRHARAATRLRGVSEWNYLMLAYTELMAGNPADCLRSIAQGKKLRIGKWGVPDEQLEEKNRSRPIEGSHAQQSMIIEAACKLKLGDRNSAAEDLARSGVQFKPSLLRGFPEFFKIMVNDVKTILKPIIRGRPAR